MSFLLGVGSAAAVVYGVVIVDASESGGALPFGVVAIAPGVVLGAVAIAVLLGGRR